MLMAQKFLKKFWETELSLKTFVVSHFIILLAALIVLGWLYYILYDIKVPFASKSISEDYKPVTSAPSSFNLELNNPEDNSLVFDKSIVMSGKTSPLSTVVISVNDVDTALESNTQGDFSKLLVLTPGLNRLAVDAFDSQGNTKQIQRMVYFSEEKLVE